MFDDMLPKTGICSEFLENSNLFSFNLSVIHFGAYLNMPPKKNQTVLMHVCIVRAIALFHIVSGKKHTGYVHIWNLLLFKFFGLCSIFSKVWQSSQMFCVGTTYKRSDIFLSDEYL